MESMKNFTFKYTYFLASLKRPKNKWPTEWQRASLCPDYHLAASFLSRRNGCFLTKCLNLGVEQEMYKMLH